jgi:hypothetical protein
MPQQTGARVCRDVLEALQPAPGTGPDNESADRQPDSETGDVAARAGSHGWTGEPLLRVTFPSELPAELPFALLPAGAPVPRLTPVV